MNGLTGSSVSSSLFFGKETLVSAEHVGDTIVIVRRRHSQTAFGNGVAVPDKVVRLTYGVNFETGKLALLGEEQGRVIPPQPELFEFPGDADT